MKKESNEIDALIQEALGEEEATYYKQLEEEQSLFEEGLGLFKGKRALISVGIGLVMILFIVGGVYCLLEFFRADELKPLLTWGGGFFFTLLVVTSLKIYAWMQIDKNAVMREMKRLEFQVSVLIKEVKSNRQMTG